ncbi:MAG TPA: hypothetical protein VGA04_04710 [Streptosporangiaceae bacterium]
MPDHGERRPWWPAGVMAAVMALTVAVTGCGRQASATAAGGHDARRFAVTRADGSQVTVPGTRPVVLDFVSAGCVTGLATLARAQAADSGAVDIDPGSTGSQARALLTAAGAAGLATATGGGLVAAYRIQAVGTTVVQSPDGAIAYSGIDPSLNTITAAITTAAHR